MTRMATNKQVASALRRAQALIQDPKQWAKDTLRTVTGERCALGALYDVISREQLD